MVVLAAGYAGAGTPVGADPLIVLDTGKMASIPTSRYVDRAGGRLCAKAGRRRAEAESLAVRPDDAALPP